MSNFEEKLNQACLTAKSIRNSLVPEVDPAGISLISKIPYKALVIREVLLYRIADLSESSCMLLKEDNIISSAVTIRAFQETVAVLFFINRKIRKAIDDKDITHLDSSLMKTIMGAKNNENMPDPINIMTMIDKVSKEISSFRTVYDTFSELSHPNWAGTHGIYAKPDTENIFTYFGKNIRLSDSTKLQCVTALQAGLNLTVDIYDEYAEYFSKLVEICENDITEKSI